MLEKTVLPTWQEEVEPHLIALEQRTDEPFSLGVLRVMFSVTRSLLKYAESFDLVVGDDVSGRMPALVMWRLINLKRQELGLEPAALRLINGRCLEPFPPGFIPPATGEGTRAVMVTDVIHTWGSAANLVGQINQQRGQSCCDIATLGTFVRHFAPEALRARNGVLCIDGGDLGAALELNPERNIASRRGSHPAWIGVTKDTSRSQFAVPQPPGLFDHEAVARLGADMDQVVHAFAGLLGIPTPEPVH